MRVSESTVKRSMTHLITIGALKKEARYDIETGEQTSNLYTVIQAPPVTSELPPSSPTTYKPKSINQRKDIGKVIFVKLTEAIGRTPVTKSDRAGWNKVVKELSPYAIAKHWSLMLQIYEETKPKEPYNCEKSGHKWRDLGVIFYCPHCTAEKSK
jgi:rubredoxin